MGDGGTEDHGRPLARLFLPVPHDLVRHRRAVHDLRDLGHVVIRGALADGAQLVLHTDIDDVCAGRNEVARGDQFTQAHLVADIVEDLAQTLAVAPVGRRRDAEDPAGRIGTADMIDDPAIAVGHGVMRLVDDQKVERGHRRQIGRPREGRHHGEGRPPCPALGLGIDDGGGDVRRNPAELRPVLRGQLVAMGQDAGLGITALEGLRDNRRQGDGLAEARRGDA